MRTTYIDLLVSYQFQIRINLNIQQIDLDAIAELIFFYVNNSVARYIRSYSTTIESIPFHHA